MYLTRPTPSPLESKWSDEDWVGERGRERERKKREEQQKKEEGGETEQKDIEQGPNDFHPSGPIHDPAQKKMVPKRTITALQVPPMTLPSKKMPYQFVIQR